MGSLNVGKHDSGEIDMPCQKSVSEPRLGLCAVLFVQGITLSECLSAVRGLLYCLLGDIAPGCSLGSCLQPELEAMLTRKEWSRIPPVRAFSAASCDLSGEEAIFTSRTTLCHVFKVRSVNR